MIKVTSFTTPQHYQKFSSDVNVNKTYKEIKQETGDSFKIFFLKKIVNIAENLFSALNKSFNSVFVDIYFDIQIY